MVIFDPDSRTSRSAVTPPMTSPPTSGSSRMPESIALTPMTAWKYWGIVKTRPNRAKDTMVCRIVPQVKLAERNRLRSTSGWPPSVVTLRSQHTKAASSTAPAMIQVIAAGSPQPFWPASITP